MLTIIADSNIAHLHDYFNAQTLINLQETEVNVIAMTGREITADILAKYQPDALLIRSVTPINQALLADNNSVKFVGSATIGTDHVDQAYLASRGIEFANASGCSKHSVAQYVLTAILTLRPQYSSNLNPSLNAQQSSSISTIPTIGIIGWVILVAHWQNMPKIWAGKCWVMTPCYQHRILIMPVWIRS